MKTKDETLEELLTSTKWYKNFDAFMMSKVMIRCREVFRPWVETEQSKRKWHVQRLHMYVGYVDRREKGGGIYPTL